MHLNSVIRKKEHLTADAQYSMLCQRLLILVSVMTTNCMFQATSENVQRLFTKAIFPQLPYSIVKLHLPTLEMRRVMADLGLTTCYKFLNGFIDIDSGNFLVASNNTWTRGNSRKLKKSYADIRDAINYVP